MRIKFICYFAFICEFGVLASYFSKDLFKRYPKPWCEKQSPISFLSQKGSDHYYSIWIDKLMILILFHFIAMQIRAELGLLPNWVKQKTGAKNSRERLCNKTNTKEGTAWIKLKKIKTDCNSGFGKLVSLTVFQSSLSFYLTLDITLRRHICWRGSCNFSFTSIFFC